MKAVNYLTRLVLTSIILGTLLINALDPTTAASAQNSHTVREGIDFATRILHDAWDMSEFSDIGQWLNQTGTENALLNIQVQDGVFSAYASSGRSYFFALYPGYDPGMTSGKIGRQFPIDSSTYSCFYLAMQVQSPTSTYYQFTWGDESVVHSVWGMPYGLRLPAGIWKLHRIDLKTWPYISGTPWTGREVWNSLSIVPSLTGDTSFAVDWLRLTDCSPVYVNLSGLPANTYDIWLEVSNPARSILAVEGFSPQTGGGYAWDVQGIQPGTYGYTVKISGSNVIIQQGQLTIIPTPILSFTRPSYLSGPDYATSFGNAWDMDPTDVDDVTCADWLIQDDILQVDTHPPSELPPECIGEGAGESEPHIFMNVPGFSSPAAFRYLSFYASLDGTYSKILQGEIVRLVWGLQYNGQVCYYVSRSISLDVGWQVYQADLYDAWNGYPEVIVPANCPWKSWKDQSQVGPLVLLSVDPNENVTDYTFHQEFDWIRLSMADPVFRGQPYRVELVFQKVISQPYIITYYYTTDPAQPTQNLAQRYTSSGSFKTFLPLISADDMAVGGAAPQTVNFLWDTSNIGTGEYYLCAQVNDGYNQAIYCSETPVLILAP